jgi:hypothetical protein
MVEVQATSRAAAPGQLNVPVPADFGAHIKLELRRLLDAVTIESPSAFIFAGRRIAANSLAPFQLSYMPVPQNPLISSLQMQFYQHCYARRFAGAITDPTTPPDGGQDLTTELEQANSSRERWETHWQIVQVLSSGQIAVQRNGLSRLLWPGEYLVSDGTVGPPRRGSFVSVFCRKQSTVLQPGFYFAFGETLPDQQDESGPVRFYWNVQSGGVLELVRRVTQELNRFQIPFRFKCLTRAGLYERADAAVLFVAKRLYRIVAELLAVVYGEIAPRLRPDTPLFSKPLDAGLGLAEDPANGESFGSHRCRLLAEAVCQADAQGQRTTDLRLEAVEKHFQQHGLTLAAPYLGPGSMDSYEWPARAISLS